jgi:hypothetical protein
MKDMNLLLKMTGPTYKWVEEESIVRKVLASINDIFLRNSSRIAFANNKEGEVGEAY